MATTSDLRAPRARRGGLWRGAASVGLVLGLSGLMFTVNARSSGDDEARHPQNLRELAQKQATTVQQLSAEVDELRSEVERLTAEQNALAGRPVVTTGAGDLVAGGSTPVTGPGLRVMLDDAPFDVRHEDVRPDLLVVHQQDIQAVMNALWAGGAEAMGLMDQRVVSTTGVQCQGNVLRLHGRMYSPPFVITAIGDPDTLRASLADDAAVSTYVRHASELGLGWDVETRDTLNLPAYSGATELTWARVPSDVEVLPGVAEPAPEPSGQPAPADAAGTRPTPVGAGL
ncbi:DUF881 domain-containing protein [Cellulomonas xiejunii]|uniref:DUF881 domain-containing protein n=1 Tax=Cellulomonas xiejunii TaxID=2968083 RepID=A0ABY5KN59_9CELL|nr:DUF881 domain-containing protein [Cellulomonas xiejunii]MCC2313491.1 DUF881 domain-containing protein [Cellulomonas xiejunii]MCC2321336.1 DUF881 domain-containing protein [Cellulomonas xiejunii]UUI71922.1 DUF881 domain-containing protein [Cellulomonas xiejunii]